MPSGTLIIYQNVTTNSSKKNNSLMEKVSESLKNIIGKWVVTELTNQHTFYPPNEDALNHISEWQSFDINKIKEIPSNFLIYGIGKENIEINPLTDIQIEFTEILRAKLTYHFKIYCKDKILKEIFWEISTETEYCDLSIVMGEVYNYARCKIEKLDDNELILIERIDNTESDTYFHKIKLKKLKQSKGFLKRLFNRN